MCSVLMYGMYVRKFQQGWEIPDDSQGRFKEKEKGLKIHRNAVDLTVDCGPGEQSSSVKVVGSVSSFGAVF